MKRSKTLLALMASLMALNGGIAAAEDFPSRNLEIVVNAPVGGGEDAVGRLVAAQLSADLNQRVTVLNKDGAGTLMGARYEATMKPDGYTMLLASVEMAISPFLIKDLPLNVERDLIPIALAADTPFVMAVNTAIPANNPRELVAYIKQHEQDFRWATAGVGTPVELGIKQFDKMAGINPLLVPFPGSNPSMVSLLGNEVNGTLASSPLVKANMGSGKIKALAITSAEMSDWMPGLPTVASFGFPGYTSGAWYGLWVPKDTPKEVVSKLYELVMHAMASPDLQARYKATGLSTVPSKSQADFSNFFKDQLEKNGALIKDGK